MVGCSTEPNVPSSEVEVITTVATITWLTVTEYLCHKCPQMCSLCRTHSRVLSSFMNYHRFCNKSNTMGATCGTGTAYSSGERAFTPAFIGVRVARSFIFCVVFCRLLFILLFFFHCIVVL